MFYLKEKALQHWRKIGGVGVFGLQLENPEGRFVGLTGPLYIISYLLSPAIIPAVMGNINTMSNGPGK